MISAECHSDDHAVEAKFDATKYFEQAAAESIVALAACQWEGNYPADEVAIFMADYHEHVKLMFDYIEIRNTSGTDLGFECSVDREEALAWLQLHRPHLWFEVQLAEPQEETEPCSIS